MCSAARIMELADAFCIPHYRIDGGAPMFKLPDARAWIAKNLAQKFEGKPLPFECRIIIDNSPAPLAALPLALQQIADRLIFQPEISRVCGVYFLCKQGEVVYVGQSISTGARIAEHGKCGKDFDFAFIMPIPASDLSTVEGAFIRALKPRLNVIIPPAIPPSEEARERVGFLASEESCLIPRGAPIK